MFKGERRSIPVYSLFLNCSLGLLCPEKDAMGPCRCKCKIICDRRFRLALATECFCPDQRDVRDQAILEVYAVWCIASCGFIQRYC